MGTLEIPNTVALIQGGPNAETGKQLIDYLLSADVETRLASMRSIQIPLNPAVSAPDNVPRLADIHAMEVDWDAVASKMRETAAFMKEEFLR